MLQLHHLRLAVVLWVAISEASVLNRHHQTKWDHFVYALQWPMTSCIDANNISHSHNCQIPASVSSWTVHGLWPSGRSSSESPQFCNTSSHDLYFDPDKLEPIVPQLERFWPNLFADTEPFSFWQHEWCKHGTCAVTVPALSNELKYFSKGLELQKKFDLLSILHGAGIVPKDYYSYQVSEVEDILARGLGVQPRLLCVTDPETDTQYLSEIEFCISKTFRVMECPSRRSPLFSMDSLEAVGRVEDVAAFMGQVDRVGEPERCQRYPSRQKRHVSSQHQCNAGSVAYPVIRHQSARH